MFTATGEHVLRSQATPKSVPPITLSQIMKAITTRSSTVITLVDALNLRVDHIDRELAAIKTMLSLSIVASNLQSTRPLALNHL